MTAFAVSVIVPTRNRQALLPDLLGSLLGQTYPPEHFQLLFVDDGSTDGTSALLEAFAESAPCPVRVLRGPHSGAGAARNHGAANADGRLLLFLDDDMIASPRLISEHAIRHSGPRDVVVGRIDAVSGPRDPWMAWEDAQLAKRHALLRQHSDGLGPRDFYSGNCSLPADLFGALGGFNSDLRRGEDFELGYRLAAAGARFLYSEAAASIHRGAHSFAGWAANAAALGRSEVALRDGMGAEALSAEAAQWFRQRHPLNRLLLRLCSGSPALQRPMIAAIDLAGRLAHRLGASGAAEMAYSAIYNLSYWRELVAALGAHRFWRAVDRRRVSTDVLAGGQRR